MPAEASLADYLAKHFRNLIEVRISVFELGAVNSRARANDKIRAGTITAANRQRRAISFASFQTSGVLASSGITRSNSRKVLFSRSPRAPFQSSSRIRGHHAASPFSRAALPRLRTATSPLARRKWIHEDVSTRTTTHAGGACGVLRRSSYRRTSRLF